MSQFLAVKEVKELEDFIKAHERGDIRKATKILGITPSHYFYIISHPNRYSIPEEESTLLKEVVGKYISDLVSQHSSDGKGFGAFVRKTGLSARELKVIMNQYEEYRINLGTLSYLKENLGIKH